MDERHDFGTIQSAPKILLPMEEKRFVVRVEVPDNYNETIFDSKLKMDREVAFAINVAVKSNKYVEAL